MIDWNDPNQKVSNHFSVKELLWLPQWNRLANKSDGITDQVKSNLSLLANKMDIVRNYFGKPINVHVTFRSESYNELVKGAKDSAHMAKEIGVAAMDFDVQGLNCDNARELLLPCLDQWQLRMEQNPNGDWVHLDTRSPGPEGRYFQP